MNSPKLLSLPQKSLLIIVVSTTFLLLAINAFQGNWLSQSINSKSLIAISALTLLIICLIKLSKNKEKEQKIASAWEIVLSAKAEQKKPNCIEAIEYLHQFKQDLSCLNVARYFLKGIQLPEANLSCANLGSTNLSGANLTNANLVEANLNGADLSEATFDNARLVGANLKDSNLTNASLLKTNLSGADLTNANLSNAKLWDPDNGELQDISPYQIKQAKNWDKAIYSPQFREKLGLSVDN